MLILYTNDFIISHWYWYYGCFVIYLCLPCKFFSASKKRICHQWVRVHQFFHCHLWGHGNHLSFFTGPRIPTRSRPRSTQEIDAGIKDPPGKEAPKNVQTAKTPWNDDMFVFFCHQITTCSCSVAKKCTGSTRFFQVKLFPDPCMCALWRAWAST